jgi:hypothetical protein
MSNLVVNNTCSGEVPEVLVRVCSKATFFDLSHNAFKFPKDGRSYLQEVVENVRNMSSVRSLDLSSRDFTGTYYSSLAHDSLLRTRP